VTDKKHATIEEVIAYMRSDCGLVGKSVEQALVELEGMDDVAHAQVDPDDPNHILITPFDSVDYINIQTVISSPDERVATREQVAGKYLWLSPDGDVYATDDCREPIEDSRLLTKVVSDGGRYKALDTYTPEALDRFDGVG
jgi:hypothetical protein